MTPKEYKQQMRVKVVASTHDPIQATKDMIGKIYPVRTIDYVKKLIQIDSNVYIWTFNLSDVQIVTPVKFKGVEICVGDRVKWGCDWHEVLDYYMYDEEWTLVFGDFKKTYITTEGNVKAHNPLYKEFLVGKEVEVNIDGKIYKAKII